MNAQQSLSERRLELARFMVKQFGLTWTGLSVEQRDQFLDAAGNAIRQIEDAQVIIAHRSEPANGL